MDLTAGDPDEEEDVALKAAVDARYNALTSPESPEYQSIRARGPVLSGVLDTKTGDIFSRDWYPSGLLRVESTYREGVLHGITREYDEEGRIVCETTHEYGIETRRKRWDHGQLVEDFHLPADSPLSPLLDSYRRDKRWPL